MTPRRDCQFLAGMSIKTSRTWNELTESENPTLRVMFEGKPTRRTMKTARREGTVGGDNGRRWDCLAESGPHLHKFVSAVG